MGEVAGWLGEGDPQPDALYGAAGSSCAVRLVPNVEALINWTQRREVTPKWDDTQGKLMLPRCWERMAEGAGRSEEKRVLKI